MSFVTGTVTLSSEFPLPISGSVEIGGAFYAVSIASLVLHAYKSVDKGVTWTLVGGAGPLVNNGAGGGGIACVVVGTDIWIACRNNAPEGDPTFADQVTVFHTATLTWGAVTTTNSQAVPAAGEPGNFGNLGVAYRPSTNELIVYDVAIPNTVDPPPDFNPLARTAYYTFNVSSLAFSGWIPCGGTSPTQNSDWFPIVPLTGSGVIYASGYTYFFFGRFNYDDSSTSLYYQSLSDAGVLGPLTQLLDPTASPLINLTNISTDGTTVVMASTNAGLTKIYTYSAAAGGSTLTFATQTITTALAGTSSIQIVRNLSNTYLIAINTTTFDVEQAIDSGLGFGAFSSVGTAAVPDVALFFCVQLSSYPWAAEIEGSIYFGLVPAGPAPAVTSTSGPGRGAAREITLNAADLCLARDFSLLEKIDTTALSCGTCRKYGDSPPWVTMPAEGKLFRPVASIIVSSITPGVDTPVLKMIVDTGYDGNLFDIVCQLTANGTTGFVEGSGDVTWRLRNNNHYVRDLGNILVSMGSLKSPGNLDDGGVRLYSGNVLTFLVNISVSGAGNLNPNAYVTCGLRGWMYPRT